MLIGVPTYLMNRLIHQQRYWMINSQHSFHSVVLPWHSRSWCNTLNRSVKFKVVPIAGRELFDPKNIVHPRYLVIFRLPKLSSKQHLNRCARIAITIILQPGTLSSAQYFRMARKAKQFYSYDHLSYQYGSFSRSKSIHGRRLYHQPIYNMSSRRQQRPATIRKAPP